MTDFSVTIAILVLAISIFALANWKQRQPRQHGRPQWLPLTFIQMFALVAALVMAGHLISLLTGQPFRGRLG
jgi:formate hydrogenlyase subunit 3/multisubunit Na+/H+ antiporter MnhD subunit